MRLKDLAMCGVAGCVAVALGAPVRGQGSGSKPKQQDGVVKTASASSPKPAMELVGAAKAVSAKERKATLVMFHASWCSWCKRLDAVMSRPEFKKMFEANYSI